ncbi:hypothetical protein GUITHDRAFT_146980 [Guillardia theta CCMP2712]|uniref:Uncharacterized protein n=1 Tax=Guillardia theta (strain CCMP2712) TaxID=905079 RepID=L1IEY6_GUITC|nr:hypothetical protein GUITHDRAFT_146980 [Guillardia theta CCMP2712]EKX34773.1 hypothetical protein GUITHDRAFT_146980 [Guillardia theta CCMP2712]|eukprot:XP_005821753.1 hypothetical protein GUITHDRAFT_146980 [Guillardia theta CCMP2712]
MSVKQGARVSPNGRFSPPLSSASSGSRQASSDLRESDAVSELDKIAALQKKHQQLASLRRRLESAEDQVDFYVDLFAKVQMACNVAKRISEDHDNDSELKDCLSQLHSMLMSQPPSLQGVHVQPFFHLPPPPAPSALPLANQEDAVPSKHADVVSDIISHAPQKSTDRAGAIPHARMEGKQSRVVTRQSVPDSSSPKMSGRNRVKAKSSTTMML